jgi:hypothetical protein
MLGALVTTFTQPALPVILTRKDWDKKKGVIAKMAGETGIGAQCDKVGNAYRLVKWDKFDLAERRRVVLKNWRDDSFTRDNWNKLVKDAMTETTTTVAKLVTELYALRDLCNKTAETFKKSKTIPASSAQHVLAMGKAADALGVSLNKNTVGGVLKLMNEEFLAEVKLKFIDPMWPGIRKYAAEHAQLMTRLRRNPDANALNGDGRTGCRDLTTGLGNIAKVGDRGFGPKNPQAQKLFDELSGWANSESGIVSHSAGSAEVIKALDQIEPVFNRALRFIATAG